MHAFTAIISIFLSLLITMFISWLLLLLCLLIYGYYCYIISPFMLFFIMTSLPAEPGLRGGLRLARGHRGAQRSRWGMVGHGASCEAQVMNQCSKPRLLDYSRGILHSPCFFWGSSHFMNGHELNQTGSYVIIPMNQHVSKETCWS